MEQNGESLRYGWHGDCPARASPRDTSARGCGRPSMSEGRGLPSITVSGLRPRDARLISFTRVLVVGQKLFLSSGREGPCPVGIAPPLSREKQRQRKKTSAPPRRAFWGVVRESSPYSSPLGRCPKSAARRRLGLRNRPTNASPIPRGLATASRLGFASGYPR